MEPNREVQDLVEGNHFFLKRVREDLRYGQVAKAKHFIIEQVIGPHNLQQLWYADQEHLPDLIREDHVEWSLLLEDLREAR